MDKRVEIAGKAYRLCYSVNALCEVEARAGGSLGAWADVLERLAVIVTDERVVSGIHDPALARDRLARFVIEVAGKGVTEEQGNFVRLLAEVLPTLRITADGKIAGVSLTLEQMRRAGANGGHTDGVVDYAIDLKGVGMAYFAREIEGGKVKVSLRALAPHAVDAIAARFGGGGHKLAAGLTLFMPLDEAVQTIEQALEAAL